MSNQFNDDTDMPDTDYDFGFDLTELEAQE